VRDVEQGLKPVCRSHTGLIGIGSAGLEHLAQARRRRVGQEFALQLCARFFASPAAASRYMPRM